MRGHPTSRTVSKIIKCYLAGDLEHEVAQETGLSEDKIFKIFIDIAAGVYNDLLSYLLVTDYNRDGRDADQDVELIKSLNLMIEHGVFSEDAVQLFLNINDFYSTTGLTQKMILRALGTYSKLPSEIATCDVLSMTTKINSAIHQLEGLERSLIERWRVLSKSLSTDSNYGW
ncbi:MAG TPA: hypothetical protein VH415_03555 [Nitrososphaeraceae archaeon]